MDVAFVNRMAGLTRGGGEIWDLRIAEALRNTEDLDVTLYVGRPLFDTLDYDDGPVEIRPVPTPHLRDTAYSLPRGIGGIVEDLDSALFRRQVARRLNDDAHDIVHVNFDPRFRNLPSQLDCPVTIKLNGPPHSFLYDTLLPFTSTYEFLSAFDGVVATGVTSGQIQERTDIDVLTVNPGVDTATFTPEGERDEWDDPVILYVGRFVPVKRLSLLVDAFAAVRKTAPDARLVLVGDGPLRSDIRSQVRKKNLSDAVEMPGYVDQDDLPPYYRGADVFALSSRFDNHPITLLEAMSTATPVVAPRVGWIPQMIDHETTGLLYPKGEKDALVNRLERLLTNRALRNRMGERAREATVDRYTWEKQASRLADLFHSLV